MTLCLGAHHSAVRVTCGYSSVKPTYSCFKGNTCFYSWLITFVLVKFQFHRFKKLKKTRNDKRHIRWHQRNWRVWNWIQTSASFDLVSPSWNMKFRWQQLLLVTTGVTCLTWSEPDWRFLFLPPSNTHNGLFYLVLASRFISQWSQVFLAELIWHCSLSARKGIIVGHQQRKVMQSCCCCCCLLGIQVQNIISFVPILIIC